jgi:acetyl-CoA carboxylase biotin carboxyl carrier protein
MVAEDPKKSSSSPKKSSSASGPFDVKIVQSLVELMTEHDLSEIDLREGMQRLRLRRGSSQLPIVTAMAPAAHHAPAPAPAAAPRAAEPAAAPAAPAPNLLEIKSELVGTFYAKPNPEAAPFVTKGSKVTPSTVVCTIEAMKLYNEITAGVSGTIAEICVENGKPVDFNTVLFRVEPA